MLRRLICLVCAIGLAGCANPISERTISLPEEAESTAPGNYQLVPNDVIRVDIFQEPDMASEQRVAQDGSISVPLIGRTIIAGMTLEAASKYIAGRLKEGFLVDPQVNVTVVEYAPRRITILGQVNRPGSFEIPSEEVTFLTQAIALAGGNSRIGNLRRVLITRVSGSEMREIKVNLMSPRGRQFVVEPGDVITVPESLF